MYKLLRTLFWLLMLDLWYVELTIRNVNFGLQLNSFGHYFCDYCLSRIWQQGRRQCAKDGRAGQWLVVWGTTVDAVVFSVLELAVEFLIKTDPPDVLDRQKCLDALAEQRRSKWFQVCSF